MARTAQIGKENQQSIITLRHEGQSIRKMSRTLKVSSAVAKDIQRFDGTGSHEDRHRKTQSYLCCTSLEFQASEIAAQIQWGEQVFDTLQILRVFLLTKHVEVCNFLS